MNSPLWAVSALDGRYREKVAGLQVIGSEGALIRRRIEVESRWLLHLRSIPAMTKSLSWDSGIEALLQKWVNGANEDDIRHVKDLEKITNHDVKAVEYFLRQGLEKAGASPQVLSHIHFGCTSEDINNLSYGLILIHGRHYLSTRIALIGERLQRMAVDLAESAMLSRTHGQAATPTTLGKELAVFGSRLHRQHRLWVGVELQGKMNGAVGCFNAHTVAYPDVDWPEVCQSFVESLGLSWNPLTTQIENHDSLAEYFHALARVHSVLLDLSKDFWSYISLGYFAQRQKAGEVGSSTMPHKVNPIDFENAEGNLGIANALLHHFSEKLPISRLQRDLSDSTVLRSVASALGHGLLAYHNLLQGMDKVLPEPKALARDLDAAWEVLAEPIQMALRRHGVVDAYERLKDATRGKRLDPKGLRDLIDRCPELDATHRQVLLDLTPATYTGLAARLARQFGNKTLWESGGMPC